ncbi:HD domain-containing protein [Methanosarcina hadiensis]|uniref:HD domain-containing protein n=1 Tax=Methanosarcina hadiensis TaxID=3078083 RepID=UPI003977CF88
MKTNTISAGENIAGNKKKPSPEPLGLEALFHRYGIERSHADNVARNVLELFDVLAPVHGLRPEFRKLVEIAALVHDAGVATDLENHHKAGRDILLLHPPANLPEKLWQVVAWTAYLHKKRIGEKKLKKLNEKDFGNMPEDLQALTLKVAALVRIADALDYSRMESRIGKVTSGKQSIVFEIQGNGSVIDAERMHKKGDLWHLLYNTKLDFVAEIKKP